MTRGSAPYTPHQTASDPEVRLSTRWEAFILGLTVLTIANVALIAFAQLDAIGEIAIMMNIVISGVFVGDFLKRLSVAVNRRAYVVHGEGWLDLVGCVPFLQIARVVRVTRVLRQMRQAGGARVMLRQVFANRAQGSLLLVMLIAIYVIELGSMAMLASEARSPNANITTASDALWFMMVTISTVGYGDRYPTTDLGRIVGVFILLVGVGLFSTLTGFLANIFVSPSPRASAPPSTAAIQREDGDSSQQAMEAQPLAPAPTENQLADDAQREAPS